MVFGRKKDKQAAQEVAHKYFEGRISLGKWLLRLIQGAIIGITAILPGISGGVFCVIFHVYQPMMELLARPFLLLRSSFRFFLPYILGWVLGVFGIANLLELVFDSHATIVVCLFIGLVAGTLPNLYRDAGKEGRNKTSYIAMIVAAVLMLAMLLLVNNSDLVDVTPNAFWFFICGVLWGISLIFPGLAMSSVIISLGLYGPWASGIANYDFAVIIPWLLGIIVIAALFSRLASYLFRRYYNGISHAIFGVVIASTLVIIPLQYGSLKTGLFCALAAVVGYFAAYLMEKFSDDIVPQQEAEPEKKQADEGEAEQQV